MTGKKEGVRRKKEELVLVRRGVRTGGVDGTEGDEIVGKRLMSVVREGG